MLNQVEFEGYLARSWVYREQLVLRLANHRPGENGRTFSDYVTVQIDPALEVDSHQIRTGQLIRVIGRIVGRDIVEPLRLVVGKSHEGVELPGKLGRLIVRRPTVQILATQVKIQAEAAQRVDDLLGAGSLPVPASPEVIELESFERAVLSV